MLTGYQCEVVAFMSDGEFICHDCAHKQLDEVGFSRAESGLGGELTPIIRYSLDEYNSERLYEAAEELYAEREERGDYRTAEHGDKWRHIEAIAEELGDAYSEHCGACSEVIS